MQRTLRKMIDAEPTIEPGAHRVEALGQTASAVSSMSGAAAVQTMIRRGLLAACCGVLAPGVWSQSGEASASRPTGSNGDAVTTRPSTELPPNRQGIANVDARLPDYARPGDGGGRVAGSMQSVGSDTMNNLMAAWAQGFRRVYPNVRIEIEGKGSSTAPTALVAKTAAFGPMSRKLRGAEIDAFERAYGYKPTQLPAAIDLLVVFVHKDNPLRDRGLTFAQLDAIFSKTRRAGGRQDLRTWGDLGAVGEWAQQPIRLYGRNAVSGTYGYFKERVMLGGDFKDRVQGQPGSAAVVQSVASDPFGIGYSGLGYLTPDVRAMRIAKTADVDAVAPVAEHFQDYPLRRFLYLSLNVRPNSVLDPLRREFLRFVYSRQGQRIVMQHGYVTLPFPLCARALSACGLKLDGTHGPSPGSRRASRPRLRSKGR